MTERLPNTNETGWNLILDPWLKLEHNTDGTHKFSGTPTGAKFLRDDRTWQVPPSAAAGWFNVKDYGALGDNTTNDITAMRAAVTAANAAGGGSVYFPPGIYIYKTTTSSESVLSPHAKVAFFSAGGATIKADATTAASPVIIDAGGYSDISVQNLTFDTSSVAGHIIVLIPNGSSRASVRDNTILGPRNGIYLDGNANKVLIRGNYITGDGNGVLVNDTSTASDVSVVGNMFVGGTLGDGVEINTPSGAASNWNIVGNVFTGYTGTSTSGFSVGVAHASNVNIVDNLFHDSSEAAVHVEDGCTLVNVKNNTFRTIAKGAIQLISGASRDNTYIAICDNSISACGTNAGQSAIDAIGSGIHRYVLIDGNILEGNGKAGVAYCAGIYGEWQCHNWTVTNNQVFNQIGNGAGNKGDGIIVDNTNKGGHLVSGNMVAGCYYGIYAGGSGSTDVSVYENNYVVGNTVPIQNDVGANAIVRNNTGWATETRGATSVADGGTITHGLAATPTRVIVTPTTSGEFVSVTAKSSTTFTCAVKKHDNTAGTTQTVYWQAEV